MTNEATPRAPPAHSFLTSRTSTMSSTPSSPPPVRTSSIKQTMSARTMTAARVSGKAAMGAKKTTPRPTPAVTSASGRSTPMSSLPLPSTAKPTASPVGSIRTPTKATSVLKKAAALPPPFSARQTASGDNEPLKAYLRIRPAPSSEQPVDEPYIEVVNETEVMMNPPKDGSAPRARIHATAVPTKFKFSRVFPGGDAALAASTTAVDRSQSSFFQHTTLPLVDELLQGQSGLIFTYGVTNSGKSYTVQGGPGAGEAGILPRSVDAIFNSISGLESTSDIRPVGLAGVERTGADAATNAAGSGIKPFSLPGMSKRLDASPATPPPQYEHDSTTKVRVDRNYRYSVWVSYVEVYNEKIFDLLDAAPPAAGGMPSSTSTFGGISRSDSVRGSNWTLASLANGGGNGDAIYLQRKPLSLKNDIDAGGKYVAGLQEIRIHSSVEARELMRRGQENRRVFATMANRASSRSHGVFTIKVIREHAGEDDWSVACSTSRLSIVDLAGSERLSNTAVSGDRLKEAGSINKSLMCLGQCIETLRKNQARAATFIPAPVAPLSSSSGGGGGSSGASSTGSFGTSASSVLPRVLKRRPSIVPFRHSKLTELFQSFFTGEGRAVMIVNVNPYDTGFDENAHVMRFSAAAKEVHTVRTQGQATNLSRFVHPSLRNLFQNGGTPNKRNSEAMGQQSCPPTPKASAMAAPHSPAPSSRPTVAKPLAAPARVKPSHADRSVQVVPMAAANEGESCEVTIIEASDEEDGDQSDPFVEHLMQRYEELRQALFESEMRCATIEREVREEMAEEMAEQLLEMERNYTARMQADVEHNEDFVNRKLDLLARASGYNSKRVTPVTVDTTIDVDETLDEDGLEVERTLAGRSAASLSRDEEDDSADASNSSAATAVDESSVMMLSTRRATRNAAQRRVVSDDEDEDDDEDDDGDDDGDDDDDEVGDEDEADESEGEGDDVADASKGQVGLVSVFEESSASMDEQTSMVDIEAEESVMTVDDSRVTLATNEGNDSVDEDEEDDESEEASEEAEDSSDESFDAAEGSIESSFEAAPRPRNSRVRPSGAAVKAASLGSTATAPQRKKAPSKITGAAAQRRATTAMTKSSMPLSNSTAANLSQEQDSDASLVLTKERSPKKRLLGRKTLMDEETMIQQLGDSSLVDELHGRMD